MVEGCWRVIVETINGCPSASEDIDTKIDTSEAAATEPTDSLKKLTSGKELLELLLLLECNQV